MKAISIFILLLVGVASLYGGDPADPKFAAEHLLGESTNSSGGRLVLRELTVLASEITKHPELQGRHYYRCEFYTSGKLADCTTTWDMSSPGKVSVKWVTETSGSITLLDDWWHIRFDSQQKPFWSFERRID